MSSSARRWSCCALVCAWSLGACSGDDATDATPMAGDGAAGAQSAQGGGQSEQGGGGQGALEGAGGQSAQEGAGGASVGGASGTGGGSQGGAGGMGGAGGGGGASAGGNAGGGAGGSAGENAGGGASGAGASAGRNAGGADGAGGAACPSDAHVTPSGCDSEITWATAGAIQTARDHHQTFVVTTPAGAAYLYVAGGFSQASNQLLTSVIRAPIAADGTLGAWHDAGPLPKGITGAGVVVTHGEVIFAGGFGLSASYRAPIADDGSLGTWVEGPSLPAVRFHTAAVTSGDFVYVLGGLDVSVTTDQVERATINADGSLTPWETIAHLPTTLSHHSAVIEGTTLYVVAGETGNPNNDTAVEHTEVYGAALSVDGSLGAWQTLAALPKPAATHASFAHEGFLYVVGGLTCATTAEATCVPTDQVLRAPIAANGTLGTWQNDATSKLPIARSHVHQTPLFGGHVYSVAGMLASGADTNEVDVGAFE